MAQKKYEENIIYEQEYLAHPPPDSFPGLIGVAVDDSKFKGAKLHFGYAWWLGPLPESETYKPHYHNADEIIGLIGTNHEDPFDLGGEVDFWFEHEKYTITRTAMIYVPAGVQHCPLWYRKVERPIIGFTVNYEPMPSEIKVDDPMFSQFKDLPG